MTEEVREEVRERKVQPVMPSRHQIGDFGRQLHIITAHERTEPEDLLDPAYWGNIAPKLRPYDRIEARADDGSWMAEYIIRGCDRAWASVQMLHKYELTTRDVSQTQSDQFKVEHAGPYHQWRVVRKSDKQVLHKGESTKDAAEIWLKQYVQAVA